MTTRKQPLPNFNGQLSLKVPSSEISSASTCIGKLLNSMPPSIDVHSRGPYTNLLPAQKFEIEKKATEIGSTHIDAILHHSFYWLTQKYHEYYQEYIIEKRMSNFHILYQK